MVLDDDSVWEIHPSDRPVAARWLRISTITVKPTQKEDYRYLLTNTTEGEAARANYLDKTMPGTPGAPRTSETITSVKPPRERLFLPGCQNREMTTSQLSILLSMV